LNAYPREGHPTVTLRRKRWLAAVLVSASCLAGRPAASQPASYPEFRAAAVRALGADPDTLEFRAAGWDACLGQAWAVTEGWARWELTDYRRVIDYAAGTSTQSAMRRAGMDPDRLGGCGAQPDAEAQRQQSSIGADAGYAARLPIALTPHGILRLADTSRPELSGAAAGWTLSVPVTSGPVTYTLTADYGTDYLPRRVRTRIDDPIFGDMAVVARFDDYRDFGGVRFPQRLSVAQGGMTTLELTIDSVTPGVESPEIGPPRGGAPGGAASDPAYVEIGDGVYVMLGAYQAVAVEFEDFAVVIDGMQNDARTQDIIELTHEAIPGKPIRFAVNTHSHFDHASGLRQYAAEGATILTHAINAPFFREALAVPRTLNPAIVEPSRVQPTVTGLSERYVISDASGQRVELIPLAPSPHAADMLIAYLPAIGTIVESDILQPWINPIFAGGGPGAHPMLEYFHAELEREQLDYTQFVPVHTPPEPPTMPRSALQEAVGQ
jgi:glyoxylase-like metal-dependent hydrolase (beta-lactamase superfamily II)